MIINIFIYKSYDRKSGCFIMRRRVIYCIFNKTVKQLSLEKMFAYYGIVVEYINQDELKNFKFYKNDSIYTIAVLKIINEFIDLNKYQITSKHELLTHVTDKCELSCYTSSNWLCTEVFIAARDGYLLDPIQGKFLSKHSLLVEEINSNKLHSCSQDMAVSQFICKYIYYEKPINLNFNFLTKKTGRMTQNRSKLLLSCPKITPK